MLLPIFIQGYIFSKKYINNKITFSSKYPFSQKYYEEYIKRLNSKNITDSTEAIINESMFDETNLNNENIANNKNNKKNKKYMKMIKLDMQNNEDEDEYDYHEFSNKKTKSENFEVIKKMPINFNNVGGYTNIKNELYQCIDILKNYSKYSKFNVRVPKGLILEGPPGTGKTLLAKAFAGEAKCSFIAVSGSDFQEKYIGIGPTRIKELFKLAKDNVPCIIFIDEIDALGRKRSDGESSASERDSTLNALLVELDGFKNNTGIFVISATNRIDLLDDALTRPGRIDKKIYIGLPDKMTREKIIDIHIKGKPFDNSIIIDDLVEFTEGLSCAQIENLLNEAMLFSLRENRETFNIEDFDKILNRMIAGWQSSEHEYTSDILDYICIHEMGHAIVGILAKHHSKMSKVVINLSSPKSPGYTIFEPSIHSIHKREALFEHLMILLAGRIAEETFFDISVTTGAINDFEEALKLAERMVIYYGMGKNIIYPSLSEKYKELIDIEVINLINDAYKCSKIIISNSKSLILETSQLLKKEKILKYDEIVDIINTKYSYVNNLKTEFS